MLPKVLIASVLVCSVLARGAVQSAQLELIAADKGIWEAIAGPHANIDQVSAALAPDYIDIDGGVRHSRQEVMRYLQGLTKFSFQYGAARAYILSPTSGYVIAELTYSSVQNGTATTGKVLTATIFSKDSGRWIAHLHTEMDMKSEAR